MNNQVNDAIEHIEHTLQRKVQLVLSIAMEQLPNVRITDVLISFDRDADQDTRDIDVSVLYQLREKHTPARKTKGGTI